MLIKLAQDQSSFDSMIDVILDEQNIEKSELYRKYCAGAVLQQLNDGGPDTAVVDTDNVGNRIRKQVGAELAYYVLHPEKRPQPESTNEAPQEAPSGVE